MDSHNLFLTRTTYRLLHTEYCAALIAAVVLALIHLGHIRAGVHRHVGQENILAEAALRRHPAGRVDYRRPAASGPPRAAPAAP